MDATDEPRVLKLNITLPALSIPEIASLIEVCKAKNERFPVFCRWIAGMLVDELRRREQKDGEPEMVTVPTFTGREFADVILGSYVFSRYPFTDKQHRFLDDIGEHITGAAAGVIEHHLADVKL
jgi:hypothetical protein